MIQQRVWCKIEEEQSSKEYLIFSFSLGPLRFFCRCDIPGEGEYESEGTVKIFGNTSMMSDWAWTAEQKIRCRVKETRPKTEILSFTYTLGPIRVICICNIPDEGRKTAVGYVKIEIINEPSVDWVTVPESLHDD